MYARAHRHFYHAAAAAAAGRTHEWTRDSIYERVRFARHRSAFIAVSAVMGRWGKVKRFRNPLVPSLSLFRSFVLAPSEGRQLFLPTRRRLYRTAPRYVSAREIVFERPIVWHTPALPEDWPRKRGARRQRVLFFFSSFLSPPALDREYFAFV